LKFGFIVVLSNSIDLMWTKTTIKPAGKHIFLRFLCKHQWTPPDHSVSFTSL